MSEGRELDRSLLTEIRSRLERTSEAQHRLARDHRILTDAATRLRLGRVPRPCWPRSESRARSCCWTTVTFSSRWPRHLSDR